ncbi:MAG: Hsp20/alpha crystallin family protein [Syntrophorhabdaceae bacterium]|nr:Hsp20/alpha crystallin family protein [Syntrophorhabdaceae bacterium]MDD4196631.1 Hsp20/alpha crystallin family protein [Syntrophorhabdaceae bacterium]
MPRKRTKELVKAEHAGAPSVLVDMENWFEDFFRRPLSLWGGFPRLKFPVTEELMPSVDIFEEKDDVVVKAELPGIKKEDLDITLTDDTISISGEKKKEEEVSKKNYHRWECSYGSFSRSFTLPAEVQSDKAKAQFKDGVLEIRIPKTEEAVKKEKKVKIE